MRDGVLAALFHAARDGGARDGRVRSRAQGGLSGGLGDGTPSATEAEATRTTLRWARRWRELNELDRSDRSADVFENAYRYDAAAAGGSARRGCGGKSPARPRADRMYT